MSVDPVTDKAPPANIAAIIAGELAALAADAQTLGARLSSGDVVQAVVLPSNGLTDLLEVDGLRVAAELPPTLLPGEVITVMVTGAGDGRINLRILSMPQSAASERTAAPGVPAAATALRSALSRTPHAAQNDGAGVERAGNGPATPRASLATAAQTAATGTGAAATGAPAAASLSQAPAMRGSVPAAPWEAFVTPTRPVQPLPSMLETIEARLAAAHAMPPPAARPPVVPQRRAEDPPTGAPRPFIGLRSPVSPPPASVSGPPPARGLATFREPVALLRALHLAVTATNLASARMALESPEKLPGALAALDRALANTADLRVATLRTLTTFVARLDPRSPVFATQIAAFVDHVVTGREAKLAQFARALDAAAPAGEHAGAAPSPPALERIAVARAALDYDLKTQLLTLAAQGPPADAAAPKTAGLNAAVAGALSAITALQLGAVTALGSNPDGLAFTLPVALPDGFAAAHVRIDRDTPDGKKSALDDDNFHIAFVLETRRLGTIAIDVLTVGRAVTLSVKTEAAPAQRAFGAALGGLTARLENLRYRVVKADAAVAAIADTVPAPGRPAPVADPARLVDTDA